MKPLHVCILNLGSQHWLGGKHYFENLIRALVAHEDFNKRFRLSYVLSEPDENAQCGEIGRLVHVLVAPEIVAPSQRMWQKVKRLASRQFLGVRNPTLHRFLLDRKVDFAYPCSTGGESNATYSSAHWIADIQYKHYPQYQSPQSLSEQNTYLTSIAANSGLIIVSSEFGKQDVIEHFGVAQRRLFTLPFRVYISDQYFDPAPHKTISRYNLPERYMLASNQFWQNKNHISLFEAIADLKNSGNPVPFVLTGHVYDPRFPKYSDAVHAAVHELGIADLTFILGAIPRQDHVSLLRCAQCIVQPSLFEGWNTSIEEARLLGRPVIASDIAVHREQYWPGISLFKADSTADLATTIATVWAELGQSFDMVESENRGRSDYNELRKAFATEFLGIVYTARSTSRLAGKDPE